MMVVTLAPRARRSARRFQIGASASTRTPTRAPRRGAGAVPVPGERARRPRTIGTFSPAVDARRALRTDAVARFAVLASRAWRRTPRGERAAAEDAARRARRGVEAAVPSVRLGVFPLGAALAAVVVPNSELARAVDVDVNVEDLARLLKRHGVHVPASAYDDHVADERRRKAWRLVGAALLTALVAVAREMM